MLPHHKTTICDGKGENRKFKHVLKEFKDAMMEAQGKPIIFCNNFFGSYQIGKSSTLKLLTGDKSIAVGNGRDEETTGAFIYGPLPYNDFRKKFGMEIIPNNETQIFFIDTEGSDGFNAGDGQIQAGHYLMSQLIYPYAALSSVIISMLETNFSNGVADTIKEILKTIDLIIRGTLKSDLSKNLIALVRNVPKYQPSKGKFDKYQKKSKKVSIERYKNTIQYNDFIPLYPIDINADIMAQGFEFNLGFKIFAQRLINHIEEARKEFTFDWESACEMFENLINLPEQQDIIQVIIQIFQDTQNKNYENKYKPIVEEIIKKKIQELDNKINEIESSIKEGTIIELPIIDSVKIIKELTEEFDSKIEEGKVKDSNVYKELKRKISDEISTKCKVFNELRDQMKQLQHKHLQDEINSYIETKKKQSEQTMTNSKSSDLGELLRSCSLDSDDCINELNRIGSEEKIDFSIIMEIQENINTEIHQINDEIKQEAKKVVENNKKELIIELKKQADVIIEEEIEQQKADIQNSDISKYTQISISLLSSIKRKILTTLKNESKEKIPKEIRNKIDNYIYNKLIGKMDELNTVIKQEKETRIKKTTKDLEDKMLSFISERMAIAQEKINNILSTDESAILNESRIRNLENECQLELDRICLQSNINQTARQQVEDFILSQAKSILIEMGQNAHKIAGENTEKVIESLKQIAESIMKNEVTAQEYNIKRSDFEKLNRISRNLNDMITNNCINEFKSRYSGSVNESINKKLEDYITSQIQTHMKSLNQLSEEERNKKINSTQKRLQGKDSNGIRKRKMSIRTEMQNRSGSPSDVLPCNVVSRLNRKCDYVISDANESIRSELKAYSASLLSECVEELKNEAKVISKKSQKFKKGVGKFFKTLGKVASYTLPNIGKIILK